MGLQVVLAVGGPAITVAGAALLAYDVLRGPARQRREHRHVERLDAAEVRRDDTTMSLERTRAERSPGEQEAGIAESETIHANTVRRAETIRTRDDAIERVWTYRLALCGLLMVMVGGIAETIAALMAAGLLA